MAFSSLIIVIFIFLLAGLVVIRPILEDAPGQSYGTSGQADSLLAERERLYAAIEELDLNLELQKISEEEYAQARQELLIQAAAVVEKLEKLPSSARKKKKSGRVNAGDDELDRLIAERRKALKHAKEALCPSCGKAISPADQFCSHCGEKV